jgi:hypothetical protein
VKSSGTASSADLGNSSNYSIVALRTEVENGFEATAFVLELVGPKAGGNSV